MQTIPSNIDAQAVGGDEAALRLNTLLAFGAILFAAMQGVLCLESADPCRLSFQKLVYLMILEVLEVIVVVISEVISFSNLRGPLRTRLTWLQWLPPCLLFLGLFEMIIDVYFTLYCSSSSRVHWIPFSNVGIQTNRFNWRVLKELVPLLFTCCLSLVLVGWRQKWWMEAKAVSSAAAKVIAEQSGALSVGALGFCIGWGFLLTGGLLLSIIIRVMREKEYMEWRYMFNPNEYWRHFRNRTIDFTTNVDGLEERLRLNEILYTFRRAIGDFRTSAGAEMENARTAPVCIGNAIVGRKPNDRGHYEVRRSHVLILFAEHFTILPLQVCVVIGLVQVHKSLDVETYTAMKELVDAVIVVAFVEIAVGLKSFFWGSTSTGELHRYDKRIGD